MWAAIVIIVIAILIAVLYRPKVPSTAPQQANAPEVMDGRKIKRVYGTVWIDDPMVLGWRAMGTIPIKSGGKK